MIDLKGELANSKAGQAAIKQAVDSAAKEHAAGVAREKALKVTAAWYICCNCIARLDLTCNSHDAEDV